MKNLATRHRKLIIASSAVLGVVVPLCFVIALLVPGLLEVDPNADYPFDSSGNPTKDVLRQGKEFADAIHDRNRSELLKLAGDPQGKNSPGVDQWLAHYGGRQVTYDGYNSTPPGLYYRVACGDGTSVQIVIGLERKSPGNWRLSSVGDFRDAEWFANRKCAS